MEPDATTIPFKDYVDVRFDDIQGQLDRRITASHKELEDANRHFEAKFQGTEKAAYAERDSVDKRLTMMNEFRQQLADERNTFLPREVYDTTVSEWASWRSKVDSQLVTYSVQQATLEAGRNKLSNNVGLLIAGLMLFISVGANIIAIVTH